MKISELIKELQEQLDEFGDLNVYFGDECTYTSPIESIYYEVVIEDIECNPLEAGIVIES